MTDTQREIKFRAWDKNPNCPYPMIANPLQRCDAFDVLNKKSIYKDWVLMQFTGLLDKNGKEIYEGDIVGEETVYHFIEREGWEPGTGNWKIIGEKSKNFTGREVEKYIAGYKLRLVEWKDSSCGFEPFSDSEENCGHCGGGSSPNSIEVIGNIYENPELIKE